jgi:hypothetical protein
MKRLALLIILALLGCASRRQGREHEQEKLPMNEISALKEVCEILTRDPLSPATARDALSRSTSVSVRAARVVDVLGGAEPSHVELDLPTPLPLAELDRAFGAGREGTLLHPESPIEWMYYPAAPADRRHTCAIIARVVADGVRFVTVRRDPRV